MTAGDGEELSGSDLFRQAMSMLGGDLVFVPVRSVQAPLRPATSADVERYVAKLATSLVGRALEYLKDGALEEAAQAFEERVGILRALNALRAGAYAHDLAMALDNVGTFRHDTGQCPEAVKAYEEAAQVRRKLVSERPRSSARSELRLTLERLAGALRHLNRPNAAAEAYEECVTLERANALESSDSLADLALALTNVAILRRNTAQLEYATECYEEALAIYRQLSAKAPARLPDVAATLTNLGTVHHRTQRWKDAERIYEEATSLYRQLAARAPEPYLYHLSVTLENLALLCNDTQRPEAGQRYLDEALQIRAASR